MGKVEVISKDSPGRWWYGWGSREAGYRFERCGTHIGDAVGVLCPPKRVGAVDLLMGKESEGNRGPELRVLGIPAEGLKCFGYRLRGAREGGAVMMT